MARVALVPLSPPPPPPPPHRRIKEWVDQMQKELVALADTAAAGRSLTEVRALSPLTSKIPTRVRRLAKATDVMCSFYFLSFADFPEKQALVHGGAKRRRGAGGEGGHQNRAVAPEKVRRLGGESPCTQQSRMDRLIE